MSRTERDIRPGYCVIGHSDYELCISGEFGLLKIAHDLRVHPYDPDKSEIIVKKTNILPAGTSLSFYQPLYSQLLRFSNGLFHRPEILRADLLWLRTLERRQYLENAEIYPGITRNVITKDRARNYAVFLI